MKNDLTRQMGVVGSAAAALLLAAACRADSYSPPNGVIAHGQLDWDISLNQGRTMAIQKFDPTRGQLQSVQLEFIRFDGDGLNRFENHGPFGGTAMFRTQLNVNLYPDPIGPVITSISAINVDFTMPYGKADGVDDYAGTGGFTKATAFTVSTFPAPVLYTLDGTGHNLDSFYAAVPGESLHYIAGSSSQVLQRLPGNASTAFTAYSSVEVKITYTFNPRPPVPGLSIVKSTPKSTAVPFEPVTYSYVVSNTGGVPLYNIVVKDDNGTPNYAPDDFIVDVIPQLLPGESNVSQGRTYTKTIIPPVCFTGKLCGTGASVGAGTLIPEILPNGDVRATYIQDSGINDNTYGTGVVGWNGGSHSFGNLSGSDKMEFRFYSKSSATVPVIDFYLDCVSALASVAIPGTGQTITYASGYGTAGPFGGNEGRMVAGDPNNVVTFFTSISDNLNIPANLPNKAALLVNSPTFVADAKDPANPFDDVAGVDPIKAPGGWNPINIYSVTVKAATFGGNGFGSVTIPDQHNSPAKQGCHQLPNEPICWAVNNTATAKAATTVGGPLNVSATPAVAHVDVCPAGGGAGGGGGGGGAGGWIDEDIGAPKTAGSASVTGTQYTVKGSGNDIGGSDDKFNFDHQAASGDCTIVAQILSVENIDKDSRAGVMIRASNDKKSKFEGFFLTPSSGLVMVQRDGGGALKKGGIVAPYWVKIVRVGDNFTTSYSPNGSTWTTFGVKTISMPADVLIGLAVCSHKDDKLCTAVFDNVTIIP